MTGFANFRTGHHDYYPAGVLPPDTIMNEYIPQSPEVQWLYFEARRRGYEPAESAMLVLEHIVREYREESHGGGEDVPD